MAVAQCGFSTPVLQDGATSAAVEVMDEECYLIRGLLEPEEQAALFHFIQERDKTPWDCLPRAMVPTPKTLLFGENQPSVKFEFGEKSVIGNMVGKANDILYRHGHRSDDNDSATKDLCKYQSLSMAAIRYEAPDGHFPPHIDHCDNSYVYLTNLGCTANFMVKGPGMADKRPFKFRSGDLLVFNASTRAALLHGVMSIDDASCPQELGNAFPVLQKHRYGIQCRMHL
mmetsp:Transcript_84315/g.187253  ORF Transcript_84315/g.187253 Transcript_84315/m.187253 type:complete len:228 (-) Transcript_84315:118-801(-)|eukprot:CAMPEP_0180557046 /NCGR_PEP_ID=MMETSP1037_2-20121125/947_1 /TAXON_ID=632150 /ORGANISM="Azadinium spinosum, Strain 3D9" /LENGTH=227 /DNA_ID=CAMNT_0022573211 /DNA_START=75 /DNA_END=758 /DNA_ORIENTATION=-